MITFGGTTIGRDTLMFPYCWVCGKRFKTSTPPGPANRNDHHLVPQNAGGTDGPLVSLCADHHNTLHRIAERMHIAQGFLDLLSGEPRDQSLRLVWLATVCYKSEKAVEDDPNKHLGLSIKVSTEEVAVIDALRKRYNNVSRKDLILLGLRLLAKNLENGKP